MEIINYVRAAKTVKEHHDVESLRGRFLQLRLWKYVRLK